MTARRRGLSDKQVAALPRKAKRYIVADPELRGHYVRVPARGPCVFAAVARGPFGKQIWATIGTVAELKIDEARDRAREAIKRIKAGQVAIEPPRPAPDTVAAVCENWLLRHVEKNRHRTAAETRRVIERHILPVWGNRVFTEITRRDIAALLDVVEDKSGARTADTVLTTLQTIAGWVQRRDDDYVPPFVRGMKRETAEQHNRSRVLSDDELRAVWRVAGEVERLGPLCKLLLLTAQRREKVVAIRWDDIQEGVWNIRTQEREKGNAGRLALPAEALVVLDSLPRFVGNPHVFAGRGDRAWLITSKLKRQLDNLSGVKGWRLHDLRRTARSLMSRAGVSSEVAERVLGHAIRGVEGIYNRHSFDAEKADALAKLAALIEKIVGSSADI
jgi:integrase